MRYVVLGSSAAGMNGVRELRRLDKEAEIVLISKDKGSIPAAFSTTISEGNGTGKGSALRKRTLKSFTVFCG